MKPETRRRVIAAAGVAAFAGLMVGLFFAIGKPMGKLFENPERFREWVRGMGFGGKLAFM